MLLLLPLCTFRPIHALLCSSQLGISYYSSTIIPTTNSNSSIKITNTIPSSSPPPISTCSPLYRLSVPISCCSSNSRVSRAQVNMENCEEVGRTTDLDKLRVLWRKIEPLEIDAHSCAPGFFNYLICPKCGGGKSMERSLSFHISQKNDFAMWRCFRVECGWAGQVFVDNRVTSDQTNQISRVNPTKELTEKTLGLEPLGEELITFFSERMISKETLQRNAVMQISGKQNVIAFCYRRNGVLVNCKYRSINKKFWQEKGAEKILYGLDDIKEANEIIIVEGEIDKLSMEEAGFRNCISVPDGAPQKVSEKELPCVEKDTRFQYLWNCQEYLDKASRIILATDGDMPGQVLAEEIARRLGKERCWQVSWPKKDESSYFKDANEVLTKLGSDALRDVIQKAEIYGGHNLNLLLAN